MKYDVKRYSSSVVAGAFGDVPCYLILDDNKKPLHVLPPECESVEMGREFLAWWEDNSKCAGDSEFKPGISSSNNLTWSFRIFLESREPAGEQPSEPKPDGVGESDYHITSYYPLGNNLNELMFKIEHIKSSNLVPLTFESRLDAEGFLKWWILQGKDHLTENSKMLHRKCLGELEQLFKRYKAEQELEYVCPYCENGGDVMRRSPIGGEMIQCDDCGATSPYFDRDGQPHKSWIKEPV